MNGLILKGSGAAQALNQKAREETKLRLLADIRADLAVCEIEGWDTSEYLVDLHELISHFNPCKEMTDG